MLGKTKTRLIGPNPEVYFIGLSGVFKDRKKYINADIDTFRAKSGVNQVLLLFRDLFGGSLHFSSRKDGYGYFDFVQNAQSLEDQIRSAQKKTSKI